MENKRDIFFDTKAGRAFLFLMSFLLIVGGGMILYFSILEKEYWWLILAIGSIVSGVSQILVCNRKQKQVKDPEFP